eukprot:1323744-Pyramimonas_sp.AAC.1
MLMGAAILYASLLRRMKSVRFADRFAQQYFAFAGAFETSSQGCKWMRASLYTLADYHKNDRAKAAKTRKPMNMIFICM